MCVGTAGPVQDITGSVNQLPRKGTKRGKSSPYPSPNKLCNSHIPKIHRRAQSGVENAHNNVDPVTQPQIIIPITGVLPHLPGSIWTHH